MKEFQYTANCFRNNCKKRPKDFVNLSNFFVTKDQRIECL